MPEFEEPTVKDEDLRKISEERRTRIKVVGVGGAGCNTISRLADIIKGPELIAINTDAQHLLITKAPIKILIGRETTKGLGAGANPDIGRAAAKENINDIKKVLKNADMVFITCGLGGGTGTGAAPIIAEVAKEQGALTVAVVTLPFSSEGAVRWKNAMEGLEDLQSVCDTVIVIPNDKLLEIVPKLDINSAFKVADEILANAVKAITEIVTRPQLVNVDFADVKTIMQEGGVAMIGFGESDSENRAVEAVNRAINNPLLSVDVSGAKAALVVVSGGNVTIEELNTVMKTLEEKMDKENSNIIMGADIRPDLGDTLRVILIVTGVKSPQIFGKARPLHEERVKKLEKQLGIEFVE